MHSHTTVFHIITSVSYYEREEGWTSPTVFLISHVISVINSVMGRLWQETTGSSHNILQEKHFAVARASSWETHLKVPSSWSHLTEETVPAPRVPGAPHGVRAGFLHPCSSSLHGDFRSLTSATQDLLPSFLLPLWNWVKISTCRNPDFFVWFWARAIFFSALSTERPVQWAPLAAGAGWCVCKAGGDVWKAKAEYISCAYGRIQASPL